MLAFCEAILYNANMMMFKHNVYHVYLVCGLFTINQRIEKI